MDLREFCDRFYRLLGERPGSPVLDGGQQLLRELLRNPDWFAEFLQGFLIHPDFLEDRSGSVFDNEIRLYRSPDRSFVVLAYLWDSRNLCPVHDHNAWGMIGALLHPMREIKYRRLDDGRTEGFADLEQVSDLTFQAGETGMVLPLDEGIHRTGGTPDRLSISVGVYGRSVRQGLIHFFNPAEKRVSRASSRVSFRKVLALQGLSCLEEILGEKFLTPSLLQSLPPDLVREFQRASSSLHPSEGL